MRKKNTTAASRGPSFDDFQKGVVTSGGNKKQKQIKPPTELANSKRSVDLSGLD